MYLEEKTFRRNIKVVAKGPDIYAFGIVDCRFISESGHIIVLWYQAYYVPGLPKYLRILPLQSTLPSEGYKGTFIAHCYDDHDGYAELNLMEDKPG